MFVNIFTNHHFKREFFGNARGSGVPNFPPMSSFKKFKFICPPIEIQAKFVQIKLSIEQIKNDFLYHLQGLENLYARLSQDAFKGDLDLNGVDLRSKIY
jgi:type I restriction enzyme S subunit